MKLKMKMKINKTAYINPGTGAAIIGAVYPILIALCTAVLAFTIKYFWKPIKSFFKKMFKKDKEE